MKKILFLFLFATQLVQAQTSSDSTKMAWWKAAKFGMFIHWGVYSVPAGMYHGQPVKGIGEWIMNTAKIPVAEYKSYAKEFNPIKYNPEGWVKMAKDAGVKYIVITSKHHDGFALFDSKVTDWDIVDASPYGKDLLKPLVAACRKQGVKIGFYYSQAQDWNHPGGAASGGHWDKAQDGDFDAYLEKIALPQVKEILENYGGLDVLWYDTPQNMTKERAAKFMALTNKYPNLIINNRLGGGYDGDSETPEQYVPATGFPGRNWESCLTMNDTWGYKSYDNNWKPAKELIRNLADVASKGGNMLLNVGPMPTGEIPQPSITLLAEMGQWMKKNSESIYGTSPSPFPYLSWGRCSRKGQKLYLHVFDYPTNGLLAVPMANKISKAYFLTASGKALAITKAEGRSVIKLPAMASDSIDAVVVVEFDGEPMIAAPVFGGKKITASSTADNTSPQNLLDADRKTKWQAAKGERSGVLEIDLGKPVSISSLIADEPWHLWEARKQKITLQYQSGNEWKTAVEGTSNGTGFVKNFTPVTGQHFRLLIENKDTEPVLLEWQMYGPE